MSINEDLCRTKANLCAPANFGVGMHSASKASNDTSVQKHCATANSIIIIANTTIAVCE